MSRGRFDLGRKAATGRWHAFHVRFGWLSLALVVATIASGMVLVNSYLGTTGVLRSTERLVERDVVVADAIDELRYLDDEMTYSTISNLLAVGDEGVSAAADWRRLADQLDAAFAVLRQHADADEIDALDAAVGARSEMSATEVEHQLLLAGRSGALSIIFGEEYAAAKQRYQDAVDGLSAAHDNDLAVAAEELIAAHHEERRETGVAMAVMTLIFAVLTWLHVRQRRHNVQRDDERDRLFSDQLRRQRIGEALEMSLTEPEAHQTLALAIHDELPAWETEVLLADSSTAHLARAVTTSQDGEPCCRVQTPAACAAIRDGGTLRFEDVISYAACPHLRGRELDGMAAVCTPVKVMGKPVGVAHSTCPSGSGDAEVTRVEEMVRAFGDRIGVLRAFATTLQQAERDPLTGLLNRRSLENDVQELDQRHTSYCVVFCDLDHFKLLNDTHGHAAGDRALRRFAEVLRAGLRPEDLIGRWGGEEFVIVMPGATPAAGAAAMERIRSSLAVDLLGAEHPRFTFSAGVTGDCAGGFGAAVVAADHLLLAAKQAGRNRVLVDGAGPQPDSGAERRDPVAAAEARPS